MDGHMEVKGRVLYASQEAWVFSGTLRENILFGQPYKPDWYNTVMEACALDKVCVCVWEGGDEKSRERNFGKKTRQGFIQRGGEGGGGEGEGHWDSPQILFPQQLQ